jgi:hypothetical protein
MIEFDKIGRSTNFEHISIRFLLLFFLITSGKNIIKNALLQCKKRVGIHNFCPHKHPLVGTDQCC